MMGDSPSQVISFPLVLSLSVDSNPGAHVQSKLPRLFSHLVFSPQVLRLASAHSSMSEIASV